MGFKDLPGGSNAKQGQSAADKTTTTKASSDVNDSLSKQKLLPIPNLLNRPLKITERLKSLCYFFIAAKAPLRFFY